MPRFISTHRATGRMTGDQGYSNTCVTSAEVIALSTRGNSVLMVETTLILGMRTFMRALITCASITMLAGRGSIMGARAIVLRMPSGWLARSLERELLGA